MERLQRLIAALWLGSAFFLMISASAAFRAAGNSAMAGDVVGAMLTRWHYVALAAPLALFALELRRLRRFVLIVLFTSIVLAAAQSFVDLRLRAIRSSSIVPVSTMRTDAPLRRQFGMLHGASMALLALQTIAAGIVVLSRVRVYPERSEGSPVVTSTNEPTGAAATYEPPGTTALNEPTAETATDEPAGVAANEPARVTRDDSKEL